MILEELKKKYNIDCVVFLEDLEYSPSSTLYRSLAPFFQEAFEPNYRFIFYNFSLVSQYK